MNKQILKLAIPNVISNITVPLLGIVDLALVGHLSSEVYIGAVSLGSVIFNFIYWGFAFLRMSTSGFTAQAIGKRDLSESIAILSRAVLFALGVGFLLILLQKPVALLSFLVIGGEPDVEALASSYFHIRIWAAPASLSLYAITGWFIGMQNSRFPMLVSILINVINISMNVMFVKYLDMRSDGVAYGTVIAQYCGLILSVFFITRYYKKLFKYWQKDLVLKLSEFKKFMKVNADIFVRMLCVILVFTFFTSKSAAVDNTILAVNTLLLQFLMIFSYLIDGFAYAAEALTGKYYGAKNENVIRKLIKHLFLWGFAIGIGFSLIYWIAGLSFLQVLTDNENVIQNSKPYLFWVYLIPVLSVASFIWDGIYIGFTASKAMRNTMLIATFFVFLPVYFISSQFINNHGLWLAMILFLSSRGIYQTIIAKRTLSIG